MSATPARALDPNLDTMPKLLLRNGARLGDVIATRHKDRGIWKSWTWRETEHEVMTLALGFFVLGLKRGERIAIVGANRPRLYWSMLAAQSLGAVPVPVYSDSVADELAHVLSHAEVAVAVTQDQEQVDKLLSIGEQLPTVRRILYDEPRGLEDYDHEKPRALHSLDEVVKIGRAEIARNPSVVAWWKGEVAAGKGSDIAVMPYTSGTTGRSKGVMLSHAGCVQAAVDTVAFDRLNEHDIVLAYLPLAWVGDHYMSYAQWLAAGFCLACPEAPETVRQDLREIGPTFYFAPPREFEQLLTRVMIRMEDAGWLNRRMFKYFLGVAKAHGDRILNGQSVGPWARTQYWLGDKLVYGPLKNVLGFSRVRTAYTAGAAIGPELFSFYRALGLNLKQLYGQTEAFLYVTAQPDGQIRADTVGPATPNVDIKITDTGEVLYKSPGQFVGYFKEPEKTAETMTADGYVKTGDAGFFDTDGHLKIVDRAKDVGRLRNGSLVAPNYIENKLKFYTNIKEAVTFGADREYVTAFINIDLTAVSNWAERNNVVYGSYQELAGNPQVLEIVRGHVNDMNRSLATEPRMAGAQVRRFLVLHKELDADDGELTRTQKVRRSFIADRYGPLIEALYDGSTTRHIRTEVTFEDGRKGVVEGTVGILDATVVPVPQAMMKEAAE